MCNLRGFFRGLMQYLQQVGESGCEKRSPDSTRASLSSLYASDPLTPEEPSLPLLAGTPCLIQETSGLIHMPAGGIPAKK